MEHFLKLISVTLLLTFILNSSSGQELIKLSIDPTNDTLLVLSDGDTTILGNVGNRSVLWEIDDPRIKDFFIQGKFPGDPFTDRPSSSFDTTEELTVRFLAPKRYWSYNIWWRDNATQTRHRYDPIIAVKPGVKSGRLLLYFLGFIAVASLVYFRKKIF